MIPMHMVPKIRNLIAAPNTYERIMSLMEIKVNHILHTVKRDANTQVHSFDAFRAILRSADHPLARHLEPDSDSHQAVASVRANFKDISKSRALPFSERFNADLTLALLSHAAVRSLHPRFVLESGVGYGITSTLILDALEGQGRGRLLSFDLPPLSDIDSSCIGIAAPKRLRHRWSLERNVGSRRFLPKLVSSLEDEIDVFISDSANVPTLQRFEFSVVWPKLASPGVLIFNNTNSTFHKFLTGLQGADVWNILQIEKAGCVTTLIVKHEIPHARGLK
jgi:predicted O-methyltransferase YrrM